MGVREMAGESEGGPAGRRRRWLAVCVVAAAAALAAGPGEAAPSPDITADELATARAQSVIAAPVAPLPAAIATRLAAATAARPTDPVATGIAAFYAEHQNEPVWLDGTALTPAAAAALARIARAEEDGLDPAAFPGPDPMLGAYGPEPAARIAEAEVAVAETIVAFARAAQAGRVAPTGVSRIITVKPELPDTLTVLRRVAAASDVAAALDGFNPPHEQFRRLKAALAAERRAAAAGTEEPVPEPLPAGPAISLGMNDERVPALRRRLAVAEPSEDGTLYDATVRDAVAAFQKERGLAADGVLGSQTLRALNGPKRAPVDRIGVILANMERWRWMPRDLGRAHVFVDLTAFTASVVRDGTASYETRVVVGKPNTPTPTFSNEIRFIVVNPYWNVPVSIASKELLPAIRANPSGYFARRNYEVVVDGRVVSPAAVAWNEATIRRVRIRQRPGDDNALGSIKFLFPNDHSVYLHDTPSKALFAKPVRAFSHGCVRVQDPIRFAEALLAEEPRITAQRIARMIGGREQWLKLERPVPVHLAYFTAVVGADGSLDLRHDVYGYDARMLRVLAATPRS
jgi:murein L,D-transpeptidase YcbB/YkuD